MEYKILPYLLLVAALCLGQAVVSMADEPNEEAVAQNDENDETEAEPSIELVVIEFGTFDRKVHELVVHWNMSDEYEAKDVEITCQKVGSQAITYSGPLNDMNDYMIEDLNAETDYEVCLKIVLEDADVCDEKTNPCNICEPMATIELIRNDSLIAVICTLAGIIGLILVGYLSWYCAKKKLEKKQEDQEKLSQYSDS